MTQSSKTPSESEVVQAILASGLELVYHSPLSGNTVRVYHIGTLGIGGGFGYEGSTLAEALRKLLERKADLLESELLETLASFINHTTP